jgi:hypothetical protein
MSQDHLEGDHRRRSAVEKKVLYAIYSRCPLIGGRRRPAVGGETRGDNEDVDGFAEPPTSDDQSVLPTGEVEPVPFGTAYILESIECKLTILLADKEINSD